MGGEEREGEGAVAPQVKAWLHQHHFSGAGGETMCSGRE